MKSFFQEAHSSKTNKKMSLSSLSFTSPEDGLNFLIENHLANNKN